jgi:hypothetical protein
MKQYCKLYYSLLSFLRFELHVLRVYKTEEGLGMKLIGGMQFEKCEKSMKIPKLYPKLSIGNEIRIRDRGGDIQYSNQTRCLIIFEYT